MDPISMTLGLVGLGTSIFGGLMGSSAADQAYNIQKQEAQTEENINAQKEQQMILTSRRSQMENLRNTQRARAQGMNASVNQGAQFGSGTAGGQAQATDQGGVNALGLNQNLQIGKNLFSLDDTLDQEKLALSGVQTTAAQYSAIGNIGSSIAKSSTIFGNIGQGFGNTPSSGTYNDPQSGAIGNPMNLNSLY